MGVPLTIELEDASARVLDEIAATRDIDRESLVRAAVDAYLAFEARQHEQIRDGLAAADRGEFASDEEVAAVFSRYRSA